MFENVKLKNINKMKKCHKLKCFNIHFCGKYVLEELPPVKIYTFVHTVELARQMTNDILHNMHQIEMF